MAHKYPYILDDNGEIVAVTLNVRDNDRLQNTRQYDDTVYQCWTIKSKIRNRHELASLLREALEQYCQHSYDCCGHWYRKVYTHTLRHIKRDEWQVTIVYQQNV